MAMNITLLHFFFYFINLHGYCFPQENEKVGKTFAARSESSTTIIKTAVLL